MADNDDGGMEQGVANSIIRAVLCGLTFLNNTVMQGAFVIAT